MILTADAYAAIGCAGFVLVLLLLVVDQQQYAPSSLLYPARHKADAVR